MSSLKRSRLSLALAVALLAPTLASCEHDLLGDVNNTYTLVTVANAPLPGTVANATPAVVVSSGTAALKKDNQFTISLTGTLDGENAAVGGDQGTWSISRSTFYFKSGAAGNKTYIGALTGDSVRIALPGSFVHSTDETVSLVFRLAQ